MFHISVRVCARTCVRVGDRASGCMHARALIALLIQHATRVRHIVTSFAGTSYFTIFFDIIS